MKKRKKDKDYGGIPWSKARKMPLDKLTGPGGPTENEIVKRELKKAKKSKNWKKPKKRKKGWGLW